MVKHGKNRPVIESRRAYHDYFVDEELKCGISLSGNEVKSIINGSCNINEAWCNIVDGQLLLHNMYVAKYDNANKYDVNERRDRILLAHKQEIIKLHKKVMQDGYTIIPLKLYWDRQYVKMSIGLCKGKKLYDKRQSLKEKDIKRKLERGV